MNFDFSQFYKTETIKVTDSNGRVAFEAVIREISYGEKEDAKNLMMAEVDIPVTRNKKRREQQLQQSMKAAMKNGVSGKISIAEEVAAIQSWTLQSNGKDVPVCPDALRALPVYMANQIVEVIERLNPDLDDDDDFPDE